MSFPSLLHRAPLTPHRNRQLRLSRVRRALTRGAPTAFSLLLSSARWPDHAFPQECKGKDGRSELQSTVGEGRKGQE